ncbi:MAG: hypothetical protein Q9167_002827 [Letrouitia subvulpina]
MRWPWSKDQHNTPPVQRERTVDFTDWSHYKDPRNVIAVIVLTTTTLFSARLYRVYLRRIDQAGSIQANFWRRRSLFGRVTSVGDADNFRLFHTPGGRIAGWGWLPWRRVPETSKELRDKTIHIRLAGVDAPELSHFGRPAQPFSQEAMDFLTSYILHRRVRAYIYKRDQYERAVATVYIRRWLLRKDVGFEMLKRGLATVYEAKSGAEFGKLEDKYRKAEKWAKIKRKGMWAGKQKDYESPRDYKTRMTASEPGR